MKIETLNQNPGFISTIAQWWHDEWHSVSTVKTIEARHEELQGYIKDQQIPLVWVIKEENMLLGTTALLEDDLPDETHDYSPWLASVYVNPKYRKQGIGQVLVNHTIEQAKTLGYDNLTLYTLDQTAWYQSMGFKLIESRLHSGYNICIMQRDLRDE